MVTYGWVPSPPIPHATFGTPSGVVVVPQPAWSTREKVSSPVFPPNAAAGVVVAVSGSDVATLVGGALALAGGVALALSVGSAVGGSAVGGSAVGGSAVGGSAVGGSAVGGSA